MFDYGLILLLGAGIVFLLYYFGPRKDVDDEKVPTVDTVRSDADDIRVFLGLDPDEPLAPIETGATNAPPQGNSAGRDPGTP